MLNGIQIIALFFALFLSYFTFLSFKRHEFTVKEYLAWQLVWIMFAWVTLFPEQFALVAGDFGAVRPLDLFTVLGFIVVLGISFYTYVNVDRLGKKLEKTVRDLAMQDLGSKRKRKE